MKVINRRYYRIDTYKPVRRRKAKVLSKLDRAEREKKIQSHVSRVQKQI